MKDFTPIRNDGKSYRELDADVPAPARLPFVQPLRQPQPAPGLPEALVNVPMPAPRQPWVPMEDFPY